MQITKVKHYTKSPKEATVNHVLIEYKEDDKEVRFHNYDRESHAARAVPEFYQAFDDLRVFVADILEITGEKQIKRLSVTTLHLSMHQFGDEGEEERTGVIFTCKMALAGCHNEVVINMPQLFDDHADKAKKLPEGCMNVVDDLVKRAEGYVNGEREQQDLFAGKPSEPPQG